MSPSNKIFPLPLLLLRMVQIVLSVVEIVFNISESNSINESCQQILALSYAILIGFTK